MLFYKLLLIFTLSHVVLNGESLDNDGDRCDKSRAKTVRLQGLTKYVGLAEICWNMDNDKYRWFNVCSDKWGKVEAKDSCQQLGYFNTKIGNVPYPCSDNSCKSLPLVSVDCKPKQDCRNKSITLCSGQKKDLIFIICDTDALINYVAMGTEGADAKTGLGVTLGLMIIIVALLLGGVFILAWYFQRRLKKIELKYSNRRNTNYERNLEFQHSHALSSNYGPGTPQNAPGATRELSRRNESASVLLHDQQLRSYISPGNVVLYHTIQEPRNRPGAYETITDERDDTNNYDTLEKVQNISAEQHYEFDTSELTNHNDDKSEDKYRMIDETKMNIAEYSTIKKSSGEAGEAQKKSEHHTSDATGSNTGHAQKEAKYNRLEAADSDTGHGMAANNEGTPANSGACEKIPGRSVSDYDSLNY